MAYIDENGNISATPPDPRKKIITNVEDIEIGVPKQRELSAEELLRKRAPLVLVLGANVSGRAQLLVRVSPELTHKGISAVQIIKEISPLIGGSGGGKAESAQAGGKDPSGFGKAFLKAKELVIESIQ